MKIYSGLGLPGMATGEASSGRDDAPGRNRSEKDARDDLKRIDSALRRLENGRFGHCLYCGDQISMTRLNFDPTVESCETCAEDEASVA